MRWRRLVAVVFACVVAMPSVAAAHEDDHRREGGHDDDGHSAELVCRNSFEPRCGPFFWDPAPEPNQRGTIGLQVSPAAPRPGDTVTFTVTIDDPDSGPNLPGEMHYPSPNFGDADSEGMIVCDPAYAFGYGPWDTPTKQPMHGTETFTHAYDAVGDYEVELDFDTCASSPWREFYWARTTVHVRDLPLGLMPCPPLRLGAIPSCL